uniref:Uncharacterized protein n=1 Tax=Soberanes virus TaxID=3139882 RepID=A0AAN0N6I6_9VIRU
MAAQNVVDANIIDLASTNTVPIRIEDIYEEKYVPIRDQALLTRQLEWTMFAVLVKGKDVNAAVKAASARGPNVSVHGGFIVNTRQPGPDDLTMKRLSACLLYDNCSNQHGEATSNPPAGYNERLKTFHGDNATLLEMDKYIPSMSTTIQWAMIGEKFTHEPTKAVFLSKVRYAAGSGLNFAWRIYAAKNQASVAEAGPAFAVAAYYMDLAALNAERRKEQLPPLTASQAPNAIWAKGGTWSGILTNSSTLPAPGNITGSVHWNQVGFAIDCDISTIFGGGASQRAKDALRTIFHNRIDA